MEALRRARYKFPGSQKIIVSKKWGFTNVARGGVFEVERREEGGAVSTGVTLFRLID